MVWAFIKQWLDVIHSGERGIGTSIKVWKICRVAPLVKFTTKEELE